MLVFRRLYLPEQFAGSADGARPNPGGHLEHRFVLGLLRIAGEGGGLRVPHLAGFVKVFRGQDFGAAHLFRVGKAALAVAPDFSPLLRGVVFLGQPHFGAIHHVVDCAIHNAGVSGFRVAHLAGFVQVFARNDLFHLHVPVGNMSALLADFAPLLRSVVFLGQPHFGAGADRKGMCLRAVKAKIGGGGLPNLVGIANGVGGGGGSGKAVVAFNGFSALTVRANLPPTPARLGSPLAGGSGIWAVGPPSGPYARQRPAHRARGQKRTKVGFQNPEKRGYAGRLRPRRKVLQDTVPTKS
ncbi:hypothetical protein [Tateyamaria pelophila]|uniref:hypothetical protein n=1 Tax=Tateyamaria pelophila TaxID=328415 RepID=UPI001CBF0EF8|nr:hypothetical protein [Tateyamaria pelophila]